MPETTVRLEAWAEGDFWLLERCNTPAMTSELGGPESDEALRERHRRYADGDDGAQMSRVLLADTGETVGSIGFWERRWNGGTVWETGWATLPEFQGRGLAVAAARAVIEAARAAGRHRWLHAFPHSGHASSNAVCRRAGFELVGEVDFEYPKGTWLRSNDWRVDLTPS